MRTQAAPATGGPPPTAPAAGPGQTVAARVLSRGQRARRLVHVAEIPASPGRCLPWPDWVPAGISQAFTGAGVQLPWAHQVAMAEHAHQGRNVIISTPAASGKSLGYLLPALTAVQAGRTALYIAPTRALAADQVRSVLALDLPGVRAAVVDGDTPAADREWARAHATYLITTPDMLHHTLLPRHTRWRGFFSRLAYVIVDECHGYRGVFGSHVGHVLRRVGRIARHHGGSTATGPVFLLASATISEPGCCARLLTGADAVAVTESAAPRGPLTFGLWEPPFTAARGEAGSPVRRSATAEAAALLADLVAHDVRTLAFTRSRRGAEAVALAARRSLGEAGPAGTGAASGRINSGPVSEGMRVAAYRSGYLPEDRRQLEEALRSGPIVGLATTTALELGVNITGLDAVLIAGWPGTRAAVWQQAGRAGREGQPAVAVLIARDDPLDTYLVHHPEALLDQPVEATVLDPGNPYVLAPHLCAAAAELPLTPADLVLFGPTAPGVADRLVSDGMLRRRGQHLYWTRHGRAAETSLRSTGSRPVKIVEQPTGRLVGTVDEPSAHMLVHTGAVYPHQGELYLVSRLDLDCGVALVAPGDPGYATSASNITRIDVVTELRRADWGPGAVHFGEVEVMRQVTSFTRRHPETGQPLGQFPLDLPPRAVRTRAVWWTLSPGQRAALLRDGADLPGAAHAAEHTAIGLLPLFAACDRWDIGGVSADLHPATGLLTVFVYDGQAGGAGFAERGFAVARDWLTATREAIGGCGCQTGCPSCIQSPKCGSGNEPLSKEGALMLLARLLAAQSRPRRARPGGAGNGGQQTPGNGRGHGATPAGGESGGRRAVLHPSPDAEPSPRKA
ncbi:MAG TPA: DEAD/DEAH box helicase [Streptosporangiaceae bacterium]|nr:DEAD/DEAH box helicase [Streptosporangiaceae bacterium]